MHSDGPAHQMAPAEASSDELLARLFDAGPGGPPPPTRRTRTRRRRRPPWVVPMAVASVLVFALILALTWGGGSTPGPPPTTGLSAAALARDQLRLEAATTAVNAAGTVATNGFAAVSGVPGPVQLDPIITPYLAALEQYQRVVDTVSLPPADPAAVLGAVRTQVRDLIVYLRSFATVKTAHLGAWLTGFDLQAAELQTAVQSLQPDLT
jgi:hypothetical protein